MPIDMNIIVGAGPLVPQEENSWMIVLEAPPLRAAIVPLSMRAFRENADEVVAWEDPVTKSISAQRRLAEPWRAASCYMESMPTTLNDVERYISSFGKVVGTTAILPRLLNFDQTRRNHSIAAITLALRAGAARMGYISKADFMAGSSTDMWTDDVEPVPTMEQFVRIADRRGGKSLVTRVGARVLQVIESYGARALFIHSCLWVKQAYDAKFDDVSAMYSLAKMLMEDLEKEPHAARIVLNLRSEILRSMLFYAFCAVRPARKIEIARSCNTNRMGILPAGAVKTSADAEEILAGTAAGGMVLRRARWLGPFR